MSYKEQTEQRTILNHYGFIGEEIHRKILDLLDLRIKFTFLGLLSACDELQSIVIPQGETLETLFDIIILASTRPLSSDKIELIKKPEYKNAIEKILRACQKFYDQITNKDITQGVLNVSIDKLFEGKKLSSGPDYAGLIEKGIEFPLRLAKTQDDQNRILTKFKEVANSYIKYKKKYGEEMTPDEAERSLVAGDYSRGGSSKKRTTSVKRKTAKRNRSNRHRRPHHHHHRHRRRTSRK